MDDQRILLKNVCLTTGTVLTIISLLQISLVGKLAVKETWLYPLFYALHLPLVYYATIAYLAILALWIKDRHVSLILVMLVAFLTMFTPSWMLENPWLMDQYPYLADALTLIHVGHLVPIHRLQVTPGLSFLFSQFILITGFDPWALSDLFSLFIVFITPLIFVTGEKLYGRGALPTLLFLGSTFTPHPNVFHRESLFYLLIVVFMYLTIMRSSKDRTEHAFLWLVTAAVLSISYPGTVILVFSVILIAVFFFVFNEIRKGVSTQVITISSALTFVVVFFTWYCFVGKGDLDLAVGQILTGIKSLFLPSYEWYTSYKTPYGTTMITKTIRVLTNLRMLITLIIGSFALVASIYILFFLVIKKRAFSPMYILLSSFFVVIMGEFFFYLILSPAGPKYFHRLHTVLAYFSAITAPLLIEVIPSTTWRNKLKFALNSFAIVFLLLVPFLTYYSLPLLAPPSSEIRSNLFILRHYRGEDAIYYTGLTRPWSLDRLFGIEWDGTFVPTVPTESFHKNATYLLLPRGMARDAYLSYPGASYKQYITSLERILSSSKSHALVYNSGNHTQLFYHVSE